ncbi:hypothetical protein G6F68_021332 [Rhizopus microsporus]|nr:hypothetical protein G6F68_021332 [Rhizopus microsporus]
MPIAQNGGARQPLVAPARVRPTLRLCGQPRQFGQQAVGDAAAYRQQGPADHQIGQMLHAGLAAQHADLGFGIVRRMAQRNVPCGREGLRQAVGTRTVAADQPVDPFARKA